MKNFKSKNTLILLMFCMSISLKAQHTILPLWNSEIPNQVKSDEKEVHTEKDILRISNVQKPTIEVYLPSKANANGQAMLIFPGGGYAILAYDWEGVDIAKHLNSKGIAGIVVKYRLSISKSLTNRQYVPLIDAQRAMRLTRFNAKKWNIDPNTIGVIGFSAGGHLASTIATHYNDKVYEYTDAVDTISAKPNFVALVYPVINFTNDAIAHKGSRKNLLGENPSEELKKHFSNELHVTAETPPTFLVHASDDYGVKVANSLLYYKACVKNRVSAEMHIYPKGGHGFSLGLKNKHLRTWPARLTDWLDALNVKKD